MCGIRFVTLVKFQPETGARDRHPGKVGKDVTRPCLACKFIIKNRTTSFHEEFSDRSTGTIKEYPRPVSFFAKATTTTTTTTCRRNDHRIESDRVHALSNTATLLLWSRMARYVRFELRKFNGCYAGRMHVRARMIYEVLYTLYLPCPISLPFSAR